MYGIASSMWNILAYCLTNLWKKKRFIIRLLRFSFIRESFYFLPFFFRKFSHSSLKYSLPPPTPPTLSFIGSVLVSILVVGGRGETAVWKSQVFAVFSSFGIRKQHFLCWYWSKKTIGIQIYAIQLSSKC